MNLQARYLATACVVLLCSGCCCGNGPGLFGGPGLFSNVNGARIAPPVSIAASQGQIPNRVAADPYYGQRSNSTTTSTASASNAAGWRPLGTNAASSSNSSTTYNPSSNNIQNAPQNSAGSGLVVASSTTSTLAPGGGSRLASTSGIVQQPTVQVQPSAAQVPVNTIRQTPGAQFASASNSATNGMPLNDATRLNNVQPRLANTGIFNRTSEYVARPNTINPNQYIAQPTVIPRYNGPNYVNGQIASSYPNQFNRPTASSFGYQNGYPNANYQPNVAQQWRQRDAR